MLNENTYKARIAELEAALFAAIERMQEDAKAIEWEYGTCVDTLEELAREGGLPDEVNLCRRVLGLPEIQVAPHAK